jgi:hypothetical protein
MKMDRSLIYAYSNRLPHVGIYSIDFGGVNVELMNNF